LAFDTKEGLEIASKLISTLDSFPSSIEDWTTGSTVSTRIGIVYRILPSRSSAAAVAFCPLFAHASLFGDVTSLKTMLEEGSRLLSADEAFTVDYLLDTVPDLSNDVREKILTSSKAANSSCLNPKFPQKPEPNVVLANGRVFPLEGATIEKDDIELLLSIEMRRAKVVTKLLEKHVSFSQPSDSECVSRVATFLAQAESASPVPRVDPKDSIERLEASSEIESNPLHFSWNTNQGADDENLMVSCD
jgi:hypothetical protein